MVSQKFYFIFIVFFFVCVVRSECQFNLTPYIGFEKVNFQDLPLQPLDNNKFNFTIGLSLEKKIGENIGLEYSFMYTENTHTFSGGDTPGSQDYRFRNKFLGNNLSINYAIHTKLKFGLGLDFRYSISGQKENLTTRSIDTEVKNNLMTGVLTSLDLFHNKFSFRIYNIFRIDNNELEGKDIQNYYGITLGYKLSVTRK